jgi:hypothetical protein
MTNIKNAFDYHNELSEVKALIKSIDYTLGYIESALNRVEDDDDSMVSMALSLAQADLRKCLARNNARHEELVNKLSGSYF